jgi:hypothetical protein
MSESAANVKLFFHSILAKNRLNRYTATGRSGGQGSAGKQPERRLRGQDQTGVQNKAGPQQ